MKLSFDVSDTQDETFFGREGSGAIEYRERTFESECFHNRTAEVLDWDTESFPELFGEFIDEKGFVSGDLLYLRLPADDIGAIRAAEAAGFYFIESSIIPFLKTRHWDRHRYERYVCPMVEIDDERIGEVKEIARATFRGLRFNLDPHVGDQRADERYLRWLMNAYEGGEDICAIMHHGSVAGFSLLRHEDGGKTVFRLAGMRPDLKNAGLGMMLYASTVARCQDRGVKHVDGGISMANCPVLNVMANLGFSFRDPTIVFHYYVE